MGTSARNRNLGCRAGTRTTTHGSCIRIATTSSRTRENRNATHLRKRNASRFFAARSRARVPSSARRSVMSRCAAASAILHSSYVRARAQSGCGAPGASSAVPVLLMVLVRRAPEPRPGLVATEPYPESVLARWAGEVGECGWR